MNPTYTDIIKQIGSQLNLRKKSLLLRTLMIIWPLILAIVIGYIFTNIFGEEVAKQMILQFPYIIYISIYAIFSFMYMWIVGFIFEIEKRIWVDSFFDKKEVSPSKSWVIAKKLLWPAVMFRLSVFVRYSLIPLVIFLAVMASSVTILVTNSSVSSSSNSPIGMIIIIIVAIITFFVYMYYLRIKLRFSWFIFLDMYKGGKVQTSAIYERMNKLNIIAKGEGFKKALIVSIGTDSLGAIVKSATSVMSEGLSAVVSKIPGIGNMGKMLGDVTKVYSEQLAQQVASYAEITGIYLLYMIANKEASQSEQEVNEYVYGLAEGE